ncbi:MAG: UTP--glucose-1-phosphate uridylyltransferase [Dehalogenimonas sp.]
MNIPVKKAVIVAAGYGTRFLPITKSIPKEMLPLLSKPLIQYIVDEIIASDVRDIIFVISQGKGMIVDYFLPSPKLETFLASKGDSSGLRDLHSLPRADKFSHVYQSAPLGLGHAIAAARDTVGHQPFAAILPDDVIDSAIPVLRQMLDVYERYPGNILLVDECKPEDTNKYGIIDAEVLEKGIYRLKDLVEKPRPEDAPSNLAIVGRYILMPEIFDAISMTKPGRGGEIQLTDAIRRLIGRQPVYACRFKGTRYDAGTPEGWLKANVAWAAKEGLG